MSQEFGIDIVGDDNKTIIHHKVSARVVCILTAEDAMHEQQQMAASAAAAAHQHPPHPHHPQYTTQPTHPTNRRPSTLQPSLGGMGGPSRPKSSISFDHVLIRLQGELSRSRDTNNELHGLTEAMNEISDALSGAVPPPPAPANLPPVRPADTAPVPSTSSPGGSNTNGIPSSELNKLHTQLTDTRTSLATHAEKVREIEGVLAEHESMKRELAALREIMEMRERREMELGGDSSVSRTLGTIEEEPDDDDSDARSIRTIVPGDGEGEEEDAGHHAPRPGTPEPGMTLRTEDDEDSGPIRSKPTVSVDETKITALAMQLESAIELSKTLAAQQTVAQETIRQLEERVKKLGAIEDRVIQLESTIKSVQDAQVMPPTPPSSISSPSPSVTSEPEQPFFTTNGSVTSISALKGTLPQSHSLFESRILSLLSHWKEDLDGRWKGMPSDWESERRRLSEAKVEFEKLDKRLDGFEEGLGGLRMRVDSLSLHRMNGFVGTKENGVAKGHNKGKSIGGGEIRHGLVTPPSPRSMSVDSQRKRRPRSRGAGGRGGTKRQPSRDSLSDSDAPIVNIGAFRPGGFTKIRSDPGPFDADGSSFSSVESKLLNKKRSTGSTRSESSGSGSGSGPGSVPSSFEHDHDPDVEGEGEGEEDYQVVLSQKEKGKLGTLPLTPDSSVLHERLHDRDRERGKYGKGGQLEKAGGNLHSVIEMVSRAHVSYLWEWC